MKGGEKNARRTRLQLWCGEQRLDVCRVGRRHPNRIGCKHCSSAGVEDGRAAGGGVYFTKCPELVLTLLRLIQARRPHRRCTLETTATVSQKPRYAQSILAPRD